MPASGLWHTCPTPGKHRASKRTSHGQWWVKMSRALEAQPQRSPTISRTVNVVLSFYHLQTEHLLMDNMPHTLSLQWRKSVSISLGRCRQEAQHTQFWSSTCTETGVPKMEYMHPILGSKAIKPPSTRRT